MKNDPNETDNRINDPFYREVLLDMKERLLEHYQDTCDVVPFQKDMRAEKNFLTRLMNN